MFSRRVFKFLFSVPKYPFYHDNHGEHIKALQQKVQNLRANYNLERDFEIKMQYLHELQKVHGDIVEDQSGICIEQLIDKLNLAHMQFVQKRDIEQTLKEEILTLDLNSVHFNNTMVKMSSQQKEYILHQARKSLNSTRLNLQVNSDLPQEILLNYCELYKESSEIIDEYDKGQDLKSPKELYLAYYHYYRGKTLVQNPNTSQEAIHEIELSIRYLESVIRQLKDRISNGSEEFKWIASDQLQESYKFMGSIFWDLARFSMSINQVLESQEYFAKAVELLQQTYGINHELSVIVTCEYAQSFQATDANKCVEKLQSLYDQIYNSQIDVQALLQVYITQFLVQLIVRQNLDQKLHAQIEGLLNEGFQIDNEHLMLEYYLCSVECSIVLKDDEFKIFDFLKRCLQKIMESSSTIKVRFILQVNHFVNQWPWQNLALLANLTFGIYQALIPLRIPIPTDTETYDLSKQVELFEVEYLIISTSFVQLKIDTVLKQTLLDQLDLFIQYFERYPDFAVQLFGILEQVSIFLHEMGHKVEARRIREKCLEIASLKENTTQMKEIQSQIESLRESMEQLNK